MSRWSLSGAERGWADVGFWVAVCFLAKISSHRPTCKTTFARLTQSQAISQSFRVFISFRSRKDTTFFIFRNSSLYKITVSFSMVIKRPPASPGGQACRWRAVNFEIHLWSSGKNADCIFGDRSASSMSKWRPAWTLTRKWFLLGQNPWRWACWSIYSLTCRSMQVKIASTDLWPQEMFTFSEMLALVESESSVGAYVCHRRPGGSIATSDLVSWFSWLVFGLQNLISIVFFLTEKERKRQRQTEGAGRE